MKTIAVLVMTCACCLCAEVKVTRQDGRIDVAVGGQPFTSFYAGGDAPKPYLHPLMTASGKRITRLYPMESAAGETKDHPHHRGLWFTHGDVNGVDFWINEKGLTKDRHGVIELKKIEKADTGAAVGEVAASFVWKSPEGQPLLEERRTMIFRGDSRMREIDFDVYFVALQPKITFGDTKEGFFAIRLRDELTEKTGTGRMLNAEGKATMKEVWGARSPWVDYAGTLEGERIGVAIFDHPGNPKHPTYWHSRDYGLFAANQFGEHDFLNDKTKDGSLTISPAQPLRFRYRVVIHPGDAQSAKVAELYSKYAATR